MKNSSPLDRDCHFDRSLLYQYQNHGGVPNLSMEMPVPFSKCHEVGLSNEEAVF